MRRRDEHRLFNIARLGLLDKLRLRLVACAEHEQAERDEGRVDQLQQQLAHDDRLRRKGAHGEEVDHRVAIPILDEAGAQLLAHGDKRRGVHRRREGDSKEH